MKRHTGAALLIASLLAISVAAGCSKEGNGGGGGLETALGALADAAQAHAVANEDLFVETGFMVYCRSGSTVTDADTVFTSIGFNPGDVSGSFCYNVSSDRKRVALSVAEGEMAEERLCLTIDLSGDAPVRSEVTTTAECTP